MLANKGLLLGSTIGYFSGGDVRFAKDLLLPGLVPVSGTGAPGPFAVLSLNIPHGFRLGAFPPLDESTPKVQDTPRFENTASPATESHGTLSPLGSAVGTPHTAAQAAFSSPDTQIGFGDGAAYESDMLRAPGNLEESLYVDASEDADNVLRAPLSEPIAGLAMSQPLAAPVTDPLPTSENAQPVPPVAIDAQAPQWAAENAAYTPTAADLQQEDPRLRDSTYSIYEAYYRQSMYAPYDTAVGTGADAVEVMDPVAETSADTSYASNGSATAGENTAGSYATAEADEFVGSARISRDLISAMEPAMESPPIRASDRLVHTPVPQAAQPESRPQTPHNVYASSQRIQSALGSPHRAPLQSSPLREQASMARMSPASSHARITPDLASRNMPQTPRRGQGALSYMSSPYSETASPQGIREDGKGLSEEALLFQQWTELFTSFSSRSTLRARKLVPRGIPRVLRGRAWLLLAQDRMKRREGVFPELQAVAEQHIANPGSKPYSNLIEQDLERSFPPNRPFTGAGGTTLRDLRIVLYAFAQYCPSIGYTEGMCLVAGLLLMHMPTEDAFWMLDTVINRYGITHYYSNGSQQVRLDSTVVDDLMRMHAPEVYARLHQLQIGPLVYMTSWIMPMFVRILPWPTLLRVWDSFLCYGHVFLLRTVLAIVRLTYTAFPVQDDAGDTLQLLVHPPSPLLMPSALLPLANDANVSAPANQLKDSEIIKMTSTAAQQAGLDSTSVRTRGGSWKFLRLFRHK